MGKLGSLVKSAGNRLKSAYGKVNSKVRAVQTHALTGGLKRDLSNLKNKARRQTTVNYMKNNMQQGIRNTSKKLGKVVTAAKGMGSRSKFAGSTSDGFAGIPGGGDVVNNTGSTYRKNPFAKGIAAAGRNPFTLRKGKGGGQRINKNLGKVQGDVSICF